MQSVRDLPAAFCWSKMGTESGEELEQIIARKDFERRANNGVFLWGVGSSVMPAIRELVNHGELPRILFSRMKSPAKVSDAKPRAIVLWLGGETPHGMSIRLPRYSFVTSGDEGADCASRRRHYAMFCYSSTELSISRPVATICRTEIANYRTGRPLGHSQVTAVVKSRPPCSHCEESHLYPVNFIANLQGPGQVRLTRPVIINADILGHLKELAHLGRLQEWKRTVDEIKRKAQLDGELNQAISYDQHALAM